MMNRWAVGALFIGAACLVAITTGYALNNPVIAVIASLAAVAAYLSLRLDGWRRLFAITVILLLCASSNIPALVELSFYPRYVAVACLVAWTFLEHGSGRANRRPNHWSQLLVGALWGAAGLATLSSIWSLTPLHTLQQGIALLLLAALVHALILRRWTDQTRIAKDLGTASALLSVSFTVSLVYGFSGGTLGWSFSDRFQGFYANPNMLGIMCALAIPLGWTVYRQSRRRVHLLGIAPAVLALALSESRTALLATLVGAAWVVFRHGIGPLSRIAGLAALAVAMVYFFNAASLITGSPWVRELTARFTDPEGGDLSNQRTEAWQAAVDLWKTRPSLGFGYSAGSHLFEQTREDELFDVSINLVHNSYLQWLLELGVAGGSLLILLISACTWAVVRASVAGINSGLVWLIVTGLLIQVTESAMFGLGQPYPYLFWLAAAAVLLHARAEARPIQSHRKDSTPGLPGVGHPGEFAGLHRGQDPIGTDAGHGGIPLLR
ncbi:O-antigen ligase family protein [Micromonospora purpureochromogenes]|uniref:O-antigen ligase family protein n=1 Tax=Micromonospora purpureochromogenes TaxID=47872 RepID=UPI0033D1097C